MSVVDSTKISDSIKKKERISLRLVFKKYIYSGSHTATAIEEIYEPVFQ